MTSKVLPLTRRESKKQENRRAIINAGRRVFATLGLGAATVKDIIRESGLAQGSFYNYFNSKEEVFEIVLHEIVRPVQSELKVVRSEATNAREFVDFAYRACIKLTVRDRTSAQIIHRNQGVFRDVFYMGRVADDIRSDLMADLEAGVRSGMFLPHDAGVMAEAMLSLGVDLFLLGVGDLEEAERRVQFLVDLFMNSIEPRGGR